MTNPMTPGERLVWAAALAEHIGWQFSLPQNRRDIGNTDIRPVDIGNAALYANEVVRVMRIAATYSKYHPCNEEATAMLIEMVAREKP